MKQIIVLISFIVLALGIAGIAGGFKTPLTTAGTKINDKVSDFSNGL